jgi:copper homeostasis protein
MLWNQFETKNGAKQLIFEVCIDSVEGAMAAEKAGAQRVELCSDLVEGGLTPSLGTIRLVRQKTTLGLNIMIRPRGGDFLYSDLEFDVMRADLLEAKAAGADAVVMGLLHPNGAIDIERTGMLIDLARPMAVTFHRAFDVSQDLSKALEELIRLGVDCVLTSGRKATALEGADCIASLVRQAAGRIQVMAGAGITAANVSQILVKTGVSAVHFSARETVESSMRFRNLECPMGKAYQPEEFSRRVTSTDKIHQVIKLASAARTGHQNS